MFKLLKFIIIFNCFYAVSQSPEELFRYANKAYNDGQYERAIKYYDSIISIGQHSPELYFNLANSHYKLNSIALSVLNYEKALLLNPKNKSILNNLQYSKNMMLDNFAVLPRTDIELFFNNVLNFTNSDGWAFIFIISLWFFVLLLFLFIKSSKPFLKRVLFLSSVFFLILCLTTLLNAISKEKFEKNSISAIVAINSESFRSEPNIRSEVLLTIHEGTKVLIVEEVEDWVKVKLINGNSGWVLKRNLYPIIFAK